MGMTMAFPLQLRLGKRSLRWSGGGLLLLVSLGLHGLLLSLPLAEADPASPELTTEDEPVEVIDVVRLPAAPETVAPEAMTPETAQPDTAVPAAIAPPEVATAPADPWLEEETAPTLDSPPAVFTEPSPWGEPIAPVAAVPTPANVAAPPMATPAPAPTAMPATAIPAPAPAPTPTPTAMPAPAPAPTPSPVPAYLTAGTQVSPSPLVYPLRSQRKIKSIAAVELPSFGRNPRRR